jgi:hypothetical protein
MRANQMKKNRRPLKAALFSALVGGSMALLGAAPARAAVLSFGDIPGDVFGGENCADVQGGSLANSTPVNAYNCTAAPNQQFEFSGNTIYALGGQTCLNIDSPDENPEPGDLVNSYPCNNGVNQKWNYENGQIVAIGSITTDLCALAATTSSSAGTTTDLSECIPTALCLDATTGANGTQLKVNPCSPGTVSQEWQIK